MYSYRNVTEDLFWIGVDDHRLELFENMFPIPSGVSYNSYLLLDEKTVLFDTVDWSGGRQFLETLAVVLGGRSLDYIVVNHMEPDHAASLEEVLLRYPDAVVVSNAKAITFMEQFGFSVAGRTQEIKEGDMLSAGRHTLTFVMANMVHWPEAMVTYDTSNGVLFSADAFGTFGALDGRLFNDELNFERDWIDEARRYYSNIVGKFGNATQKLLAKAGGLDIRYICPLHGPVWRKDISYFLEKYDLWSRYEPEKQGVVVVYGSMYGNTESAVGCLTDKLTEHGVTSMCVYDVSKTHMSYLIADVWKYSHIVLASPTYNLGLFPPMDDFMNDLIALMAQNRKVSVIENGTWAPKAGAVIEEKLGHLKNIEMVGEKITIKSAMKAEDAKQLDALAKAIADSLAQA